MSYSSVIETVVDYWFSTERNKSSRLLNDEELTSVWLLKYLVESESRRDASNLIGFTKAQPTLMMAARDRFRIVLKTDSDKRSALNFRILNFFH